MSVKDNQTKRACHRIRIRLYNSNSTEINKFAQIINPVVKSNPYKLLCFAIILSCFVNSSLAHKRKLDHNYETSSRRTKLMHSVATTIQTQDIYRRINYEEIVLDLVEYINKFEFECIPNKLGELLKLDKQSSFVTVMVTNFLEECDSQAQEWQRKSFQA